MLRKTSCALASWSLGASTSHAPAGPAVVDNISKKREPLPTLSGVYFIQPSEGSLNCLLNDWKGAKPPYKTAHVYFSARLDPRILAAFRAQAPQALLSNLRTLKEVLHTVLHPLHARCHRQQ